MKKNWITAVLVFIFFIFVSTDGFALTLGTNIHISNMLSIHTVDSGEAFSLDFSSPSPRIEGSLEKNSIHEQRVFRRLGGFISSIDSYVKDIKVLFQFDDISNSYAGTLSNSNALANKDVFDIYVNNNGMSENRGTYAMLTNGLAHGLFDMYDTESIRLLLLGIGLVGVGCTLRKNFKTKNSQNGLKTSPEPAFLIADGLHNL